MSLSDRTGPLRARPRPLGFKMGDLKASAAAEVNRAACSPQAMRRRTGIIRATPLSEGPQSAASSLIARPGRSTQIL